MTIIGIDLGTTNSLAAIWQDGKSILIPNALGENLTPSVVGIDDTGEILTGNIAKERLITHPHLTAASFKRHMGSQKTLTLGKRNFRPEELSAFILKSLKADAEAFLGEPVTEAVISVPAYFNDTQRKATLVAAQLAELSVERLINEPTAAAIAYGLHESADESTFLVFDLGGGTFDVSILELFDGVMEVHATAGDNFLGGDDFVEILIKEFFQKTNLPNSHTKNHHIMNRLQKIAQSVKHQLSSQLTATMNIIIDNKDYRWDILRDDFEKLAEPLIRRLRQPIERALRDASIKPQDLQQIVLVGGATRMPLVRSLVSKMFGRLPSCQLNPDEVVAMGAAIQAALKSRHHELKEVVLTDVCPYTLGIETCIENADKQYQDGYFSPIIERNTTVPISKAENFYTTCNNQNELLISIYQGESRQVINNIKLGEFSISVPKAPAGKEGVEVRFTYDINGILEVEAKSLSTNEKKSMIIQNNPGALSQAEIQQRLNALAQLKVHPRDQAENRILLARGERLYEESLGNARHYIQHIMADFEGSLTTQDPKIIAKARLHLTTLLDQLETEMRF